jgi:hypothetical protein
MAGNCSFEIKWLEKPEYKCLSQIQNKFKAASCNVCIKDIDISNIGGRVDLKVTFSQQNTEHIKKKKKKSSLRLSGWVNNQMEPAYKKIVGGVCGNNRFHKSGDIILTLNMYRFFRVCSQMI